MRPAEPALVGVRHRVRHRVVPISITAHIRYMMGAAIDRQGGFVADQTAQRAFPSPFEVEASCALSIVIVSYNTRDLLRACLASIDRSTGVESRETFVVDNASTDGSPDMVAAEFPWVRLLRSAANRGYAAANNLAVVKARGRSILLLNPDTELPPHALSTLNDYLEAHPDTAVVGPKLVRSDGSLDLACRRSFPTPEVAFYRLAGLSRASRADHQRLQRPRLQVRPGHRRDRRRSDHQRRVAIRPVAVRPAPRRLSAR